MSLTRRSFAGALAAGGLVLQTRRGFSAAAPKPIATVRERMQRFVDDGVIAGVVTLVGRGTEIVHADAVGLADLGSKRPMRPDTVFRIASMTKPVTALAVMMLVEEGKLAVDDPVEKHLPEFRGLRLIREKTKEKLVLAKPSRPPTVGDLLAHTSGMAGLPPPGFGELYRKRNRPMSEAVIAYSQQPLEFEPGSKWGYSNTGIDTAGRLVEVHAGKSFERFCDERIFRPLGMRDTAFYLTAPRRPRAATLYKQKNGVLEPAPNWLGGDTGGVFPLPAAGLFSTAGDLARLYRALAHGGRHARGRLLREETLAEMTRIRTGDMKAGFGVGIGFGLGFAVVREQLGASETLSVGSFGHGGAFGTQGWIDPVKKMFYVLLVQRDGMPGGDEHEPRKEFQRLAVEALSA